MVFVILIIIILYLICNYQSHVKEGFSGFHDVNTVLRFVNRCKDAVYSVKGGVFSALKHIVPNNHGDTCDKHYQCHSKCLCEKNKCKCIEQI